MSFHGAGGESLGAHGYSKDHRPDLRQMVLAVVLDGEGRPVCTEMLAGNTADMTVLLPVVDRLRKRFGIGRVCVVADRGMISAATIAALEKHGLDYILGARERGTAVIRQIVLKDERPFVPLRIRPTTLRVTDRRARPRTTPRTAGASSTGRTRPWLWRCTG